MALESKLVEFLDSFVLSSCSYLASDIEIFTYFSVFYCLRLVSESERFSDSLA